MHLWVCVYIGGLRLAWNGFSINIFLIVLNIGNLLLDMRKNVNIVIKIKKIIGISWRVCLSGGIFHCGFDGVTKIDEVIFLRYCRLFLPYVDINVIILLGFYSSNVINLTIKLLNLHI